MINPTNADSGGLWPRIPRLPRARFIPAGLLAFALAGCGGGDAAERPLSPPPEVRVADRTDPLPPGKAPNIVLVMTDDQRYDEIERMPTVMRELVGRGTNYTSAIATTPLCCPSRATFLSGQYTHNHRVLTNKIPKGGYPRFDGDNSLPVWLQDAGYATSHVGRYLNYYGNPDQGTDAYEIPPGWEDWHAPVFHTEFRMYGLTLNENGTLVDYGTEPADYHTDVLARIASEYIREAAPAERPFYLEVTPLAPHDEGVLEGTDAPRNPRPAPRHEGKFEDEPLERLPSFDEADIADKPSRFDKDERLTEADIEEIERLSVSRSESLLAVDDLVADLLDELKAAGELDETVFVFASDNGFLLGEHRHKGKIEPYEESLRIPLAIRGPGFASGAEESRLVANIDWAPTVLDLTGADATLPLDGVPLTAAGEKAIDSRPGLAIEGYENPSFKGVRTERYMYVRVGDEFEMYDLAEDPFQLENVIDDPDYGEEQRELEALADRLASCAGTECSQP